MPVTQPPIGCSIIIRLQGQEKDLYKSRVSDTDENHLYIDVPIHARTGKELEVRVDEMLLVDYVVTDSEVYRYSSPVLGLAYIPTPALRLMNPKQSDNMIRIQRREFYRISIDTRVSLIRQVDNTRIEVDSVDISGGGFAVKFAAKPDLQVGEILHTRFMLPYINYQLETDCRVVRLEQVEGASSWIVSMAFENISERERQQVVRYTFVRQRVSKR